MDFKDLYIKKVGDRGPFTVWRVDGNKIRSNFDIDFTNAGEHFRFSFIPKNELWLDVETNPGESRYLIDHLLTEWRLMSHGLDFENATSIADTKELSERKKGREVKKMTGKTSDEIIRHIHKILLGKTTGGLSVWEVDGGLVRSLYEVEYTEGGHDLAYDFIPDNEVWIDDDVTNLERSYTILHELHERDLMSRGLDYHSAHDGTKLIEGASGVEWEARHNPAKLKERLTILGWKYL